MNWAVWNRIEALMISAGVSPLLAVVPDNQDSTLIVSPAVTDFWARVRTWVARGWTVAVHGYQHTYTSPSPGLVGLARQSEFAGVARDEQARRLTAACAVFQREGLPTDVWIAPSHSFDEVTLDVLSELDFKVVNDGFFRHPYRANGLVWVPQQLSYYRPAPPGVWTICYHCNGWTQDDLTAFADVLAHHRSRIVSLSDVLDNVGSPTGLARWTSFPRLTYSLQLCQLKLWSMLGADRMALAQPV